MEGPVVLLALLLAAAGPAAPATPRPSGSLREAEAHYARALSCFERNTLDYRLEGRRELEEAVRLAPANTNYRLALADLRFAGGSYDAARRGYERAAVSDSADAYLGLGLLWRHDWLASGDPRSLDRAEDAVMTAAWLMPTRTDAWLLLVPLYLAQGRGTEAASSAFSALESDPGRLEAHLAVAATLCHLGVVGVGDSIFRAAIPRLPPELRAAYERAAPIPPDAQPLAVAAPIAGAKPGASALVLAPADEYRLWAWSRLTEEATLIPAGVSSGAAAGAESQRSNGGRRFGWSRSGPAVERSPDAPWESPDLGIRMEIQDRLLVMRPALSESRTRDGAAPPAAALAALYARILAALDGARPDGGHPPAGAPKGNWK